MSAAAGDGWVTVTLPEDHLAAIRSVVTAAGAGSVSAFVKHAVALALDDVAGWQQMLAAALEETGGPLTDQRVSVVAVVPRAYPDGGSEPARTASRWIYCGRSTMAVNEVRERLRQQLEEDYGVEGAAILMDRPPGGWSDLVTREYLDAKLDALRFELKADIATLSASVDRRLRAQTWITTGTMVAGLTLAFTAGRLA